LVNDRLRDAMEGLVLLLLMKHESLSRKGVQKGIFANLTQKKLQNFFGLSVEEILKAFPPVTHGPLSKLLDDTLGSLSKSGIISVKEGNYPPDYIGKQYQLTSFGRNFLRELILEQDFQHLYRMMLPLMTVSRYERISKHYFLNSILNLKLHFQSMWTLNFAWSIFFQLYYQNNFLTREEAADLTTLLNKIEREFRFPRFIWAEGKWLSDPEIDFNELLDIMKHCLNIDSPTETELEVAISLKEWAEKEGLISEVDEFGNVRIALPSKHAHTGTLNARFAFIFHTDTVPGKIEVRIEGGKLFGRGSVDDKVFGVIAIYAMILLKRNGFVPDFTIEVFGEASEESGDREKKGLTKALKKGWGKDIIQSVMLEASDGKLMTAQKKRNLMWLQFYGESHHSAHVNNAQIEMKIVNKEILSHVENIDLRIPVGHIVDEIHLLPKKLSLLPGKFGDTTITAEPKYPVHPENMTPNECTITVEIRLGDEEHWELILNETRNVAKTWCKRANLDYEIKEIKEGANPDYLVGEGGYKTLQFLKEFTTFFELFQAEPMKKNSYEFSTSGQLLASYGIPVIGYATAPERRAHKKAHEKLQQRTEVTTNEEYITIYEVIKALMAYLALMMLAIRDRNRILVARRPKIRNEKITSYVI